MLGYEVDAADGRECFSTDREQAAEVEQGRSTMTSFRPNEVHPIPIDPHFSPQFLAELWGISASTATRWFQDRPGVLKLTKPSRNGGRARVELRIPFSLAMQVYQEHSR